MSYTGKLFAAVVLLVILSAEGNSQGITLHGRLRDSITHFPVERGSITSFMSRQTVRSDLKGYFSILLQPNDHLQILAEGYKYDTLQFNYLFIDTVTIYLSPTGNILPGVTVRTQYSKYQLDSINRRNEFEKNRGQVYKAVESRRSEGFGLTINLDRFFKKKHRNQASGERMFNTLEQMAYINYRFSPHIVAYYTGLKGEPLRDFMHRYSPTYSWLRQHPTNEDVLYYINEKIKEYRAKQPKQ
ncbi:hypothetical protein [Aridibaculum aurantiacum]|uniref:hypothetical protein n=1 Tax=Aridibaculum aurantiacum TaxID=2810307 RepID=UPI001A95D738|nr:hypothetical protein [Aridibaculum aurantiacum]